MNRIVLIGIIVSVSLFTSLLAVDSIDTQIAALQEASPAERVELMNTIKIQLSKMNDRERSAAIDQLRQKRGAAGSMQRQQQMGTMGNMGRQEQMNQRQGLEQYRQGQGPGGGGPHQNGKQ